MCFEPPAALWDRDSCGTVSARDPTCRATRGGYPYSPLMLPSPLSPLPQFHPTTPPPLFGGFLLITRASQQFTPVSKTLPNWQPKQTAASSRLLAKQGKKKPKDLDFAQFHCPGAEFVLDFGHCYCFILKGGGGGGQGALILPRGVGSPHLCPPAPERDSSPRV